MNVNLAYDLIAKASVSAESENPSIYKYNGDSSETSLVSASSFITSLQSENRPPNNIQKLTIDFKRNLTNHYIRNITNFGARLASCALISLLVGALFFDVDTIKSNSVSNSKNLHSNRGIFFFVQIHSFYSFRICCYFLQCLVFLSVIKDSLVRRVLSVCTLRAVRSFLYLLILLWHPLFRLEYAPRCAAWGTHRWNHGIVPHDTIGCDSVESRWIKFGVSLFDGSSNTRFGISYCIHSGNNNSKITN